MDWFLTCRKRVRCFLPEQSIWAHPTLYISVYTRTEMPIYMSMGVGAVDVELWGGRARERSVQERRNEVCQPAVRHDPVLLSLVLIE